MQKKTCLEPLGTNNEVSGCLINVRHRYLNLQSQFEIPTMEFRVQDRERDRDRRDYEHDRYCGRDWDRDRSRDRQTAKWVSSREAAELSGGSDRGTREKASEKTVKTEDGVLGEFHGSTKASRRPMVERSPSSTSLDRRFNL
ncbi:unnamed protein product [Brassica rapa]|uniref:Uncharacterized protein n=1 Tax=Brassica campestris TaxID=3711 RepID=A0A8D9HQJ9_BRACM|nr:unnamed protein product [Brassica rapa]